MVTRNVAMRPAPAWLRAWPYWPALRHPVMRRLLPGYTLSALGDGMSVVAIAWLALRLAPPGRPGLWVGAAVAAYTLPGVLGMAVLRPWLRRCGSARLAGADAVLRALALGATGLLAAAHLLTPLTYVCLLGMSSLLHVWGMAGQYTLVAEILPPRHRVAGNGLLGITAQVTMIAGPALAGFITGVAGPAVVIAADGATWAVLAVSYARTAPLLGRRLRAAPALDRAAPALDRAAPVLDPPAPALDRRPPAAPVLDRRRLPAAPVLDRRHLPAAPVLKRAEPVLDRPGPARGRRHPPAVPALGQAVRDGAVCATPDGGTPAAPGSGGWRVIRGSGTLAGLLGLTVVFYALYGPVQVALPVYIRQAHHSAAVLGCFWTANAAGAVLGSLVAPYLPRRPLWPAMIAIVAGWGLCLLPVGLGAPLVVSLLSCVAGGLIYAPYTSLSTAVFQDASPAGALGQVLAIRSAWIILSVPLGSAFGGPAVAALGARGTLLASALATVALALIAAVAVGTAARTRHALGQNAAMTALRHRLRAARRTAGTGAMSAPPSGPITAGPGARQR